ncbi:elongation factor P maturation arginine rhamnosyltransferase EarP [Paracidovorax anthurii]|uniref:Protein-arginine rhamnosyltransferase n=1 Tax=Paracidovorax anthurii TaxID=78229 RepID=A0A328ZFN2_9BURK|nr:elongation factor P maturation arginine rhamnosyltransferase EarP [Paracidovorax anthurii]RAR84978.1 putative repeat protein (TIGR03837 family) [Paracidovorax anthurii]
MTAPTRPLLWDIFCQVIDNFGDIGVCWRLSAQLGALGHRVRLWTDDASALAWMAPGGAPGVEVLPWPRTAPPGGPGDVLIEAFGCEIAPEFIANNVANTATPAPKPLWINLEYLSAEGYVERSHRLPSPIFSGPAAGRTRWFFYPGFTPRTGGLLREPGLPDPASHEAQAGRADWRARHGVGPEDLAVSLFCYEPAGLPGLLAQLARRPGARLLATPGRATAAVRAALEAPPGSFAGDSAPTSPSFLNSLLSISYLQPCPQPGFDAMLRACDFNGVRGEDSLVRALWAGQPFVWHIYPQDDGAHHAKLDAFLGWLQAPPSLRRFHHVWNGIEAAAPLPALTAATLGEWRECILAARARLLAQDDLVTQLLGFVREKS